MTLLDSRLLSEYACQRMAGAATHLTSRDLASKDASCIDKTLTGLEANSVYEGAEINPLTETLVLTKRNN